MTRLCINPKGNEFYRALWVFTYIILTLLIVPAFFYATPPNPYATWPGDLFWSLSLLVLVYSAFIAGLCFHWGPAIPVGLIYILLFPSTEFPGTDLDLNLAYVLSELPPLMTGFFFGYLFELVINYLFANVEDQSGLVVLKTQASEKALEQTR